MSEKKKHPHVLLIMSLCYFQTVAKVTAKQQRLAREPKRAVVAKPSAARSPPA